MEDFNNADVTDLPDLSGDARADNISPHTTTAEPPAPDSGQEPANPEGQTDPEGGAQASKDGQEDSSSPEGTEPTTNEGDEQIPQQSDSPQVDNLSEMSGGRIQSAEDLTGLLQRFDEYEQAMNNPEMLIPEGRAREAFKYAMEFPGGPAQANKSFHHIMSLNPEALTPKELQFEAYMLREENADLLDSPERARQLFEREYEATYGEDIDHLKEEDPVLFRKHELATKAASQGITDMQAKFQSETPENGNGPVLSPEEEQAYNTQMDEALNDFGGLSFAFSDNAEAEGMNFKLDNDQERQQFNEWARNPGSWLEDFVGGFVDNQGNLNAEALTNEMAVRVFAPRLIQEAYKQGVSDAGIKQEEEARNPGDGQPATGTPQQEPKTIYDAWGAAMNE